MSGWRCDECYVNTEKPIYIELYSTGGEPFNLVVCPECRGIKSTLEKGRPRNARRDWTAYDCRSGVPAHAPDAINTISEARDALAFTRDDLANYQTQGIAGIVTELDRAAGILIACEVLLLAIARRDGLPLHGLVGDTVRNELARGIL